MAFVDYDFPDDLIGEAPCEFCGELYPLVLLIEHQTACEPDLASFQSGDDSGLVGQPVPPTTSTTSTSSTINLASSTGGFSELLRTEVKSAPKKPVVVTEMKQTQSAKNDIKKELIHTVERLQIEKSEKYAEEKLPSSKKFQAKTFEDLTHESGEKLLDYGVDPLNKGFETESQAYKKPSNPLIQEEKEDIEDINNLSDDDCKESLEEFWKRARDYLKRRRGKIT